MTPCDVQRRDGDGIVRRQGALFPKLIRALVVLAFIHLRDRSLPAKKPAQYVDAVLTIKLAVNVFFSVLPYSAMLLRHVLIQTSAIRGVRARSPLGDGTVSLALFGPIDAE